jgi:glyoxylate reductase
MLVAESVLPSFHPPLQSLTLLRSDIQVSSTPVAVNNATADIAIFLMLGALRRIHIPYTSIRSSAWRGPAPQLGYDPQSKLLGILGMGGIGQEVAARARAFGMVIQYHNRSRLAPELERGAKYVSFEELMKTSDVLSLNCSLRKETVGIIGRKEFGMMKEGVVIVNTARGKLIDEQALVNALEEGKVFSAGLDVYEEEPKVHEGLLRNENVVLLPHIGTATKETQVSCMSLIEGRSTDRFAAEYGVVGLGEYEERGGKGHSSDTGSGASQSGAAW